MDRSDPLERTNLSTRALEFLVDLPDFYEPQEESIGTLCVLAEELQPGAVVGGTIIDCRSATLDRVVFPSLPPSSFRTVCHSRISPPYIGTCAQVVCEERIVACPTTPVLMPGGVVCASTLASNRCNPLLYSA